MDLAIKNGGVCTQDVALSLLLKANRRLSAEGGLITCEAIVSAAERSPPQNLVDASYRSKAGKNAFHRLPTFSGLCARWRGGLSFAAKSVTALLTSPSYINNSPFFHKLASCKSARCF